LVQGPRIRHVPAPKQPTQQTAGSIHLYGGFVPATGLTTCHQCSMHLDPQPLQAIHPPTSS
jgi:hypothetical protein